MRYMIYYAGSPPECQERMVNKNIMITTYWNNSHIIVFGFSDSGDG